MVTEETAVYDPTATQLEQLRDLVAEQPEIKDLCNPTSIVLLLRQREINLIELQDLKREVNILRTVNEELRDKREDLRVSLGKSQERDFVSWIEIPVSGLLGYAISLVGTNSQGIGVVMLIITVIILLFLRMSYLVEAIEGFPGFIERIRRKEKNNKEKNNA